jgi:hypothetical protein
MAPEVVIERSGVTDVPRAMQRVERAMLGAGYSVSARGFSELQLVSPRGPVRATVQFSAERLRFVFARAAPAAVLPTEQELARLVDSVLGAETAAPSPAPTVPVASGGQRCGICATVIPVGAAACPLCGMPTS